MFLSQGGYRHTQVLYYASQGVDAWLIVTWASPVQRLSCPLYASRKTFAHPEGRCEPLLWDLWHSGLDPESCDEDVYSLSVTKPSETLRFYNSQLKPS